MPEFREPLVDIIVLVHDNAGWADLCVRSVEHFTKNPFRLIVVDNASVETKTKEWFKEIEARGHQVLHLAENRSFSNGVNAGVGAGKAKFIVILNNDAMVTEGWDTAILQDANEKTVGLVGARSNFAAGAQGDPNFLGAPPWLVFVCVAMRRQVWEAVGPLDEETFDGFSTEDLDYSFRVEKAGYRLKVSQGSYVLHAGSRTMVKAAEKANGGDPARIQQALVNNNARYHQRLQDKWGKEFVEKKLKLTPRVLIASYHAEETTRVEFMGRLTSLRQSGFPFNYHAMTRAPIHLARQLICDYATDQGYDWLIQLDDDATFPPDLIQKLLRHQKDVVCALAYQRKVPYAPCIFEIAEKDGILGQPLEGWERTGLRRVDVSGFHCSALHTSVIKKLREGTKDADGKVLVPGTRQYFGGFENKVGEDFAFCLNLKKIGVQVYCDTDFIAGHIGSAIVVDEAFRANWVARGRPQAG